MRQSASLSVRTQIATTEIIEAGNGGRTSSPQQGDNAVMGATLGATTEKKFLIVY
jgi:hypothetical protein